MHNLSSKQTGITSCIVLLLGAIIASTGLFTVPQSHQMLVFQFGQLKRVIYEPGLYFHIPFLQERVMYDKRMLSVDLPAREVTLGDQKRIVVDIFTRYRIADPVIFNKALRNEMGARSRLVALIEGHLRSVLGNTSLGNLLSSARGKTMHTIRDSVNIAAKPLGIDVVEVRMRRADLPKENSQAVFGYMISKREKEAQEIRASGEKAVYEIRSKADRDAIILEAKAQEHAKVIEAKARITALDYLVKVYAKAPSLAQQMITLEGWITAISASKEGDIPTIILESTPMDMLMGHSFFKD